MQLTRDQLADSLSLIDRTADLSLAPAVPGAPSYTIFDGFLAPDAASQVCAEVEKASRSGVEYDGIVRNGARRNYMRGLKGYAAVRRRCPALDCTLAYLESNEFFERAVVANNAALAAKGLTGRPQFFDASTQVRDKPAPQKSMDAMRLGIDINAAMAYGGYQREPHTDNRHKILVGLLYFNDVEEALGGGTSFWKTKKPTAIKDCVRFPDVGDMEMIEAAQPKAGRLVLFANSNDGYHGVTEYLGEAPRCFLYFSYFSPCQQDVWQGG